ncbi:YidC/Oxa1 family insertase periplasmic-domain containing protein [Candidatus Babeliales bacterium]|nr:YidC/Oxa1 family insertase periplasmic-domain containing protein [Candidatus Babeliales bacterium]MBP9843611.1 YidC/Oxa1 family insertase periplasmic-domain containing protein [Candidatus Babeliales bacterium]
MNIKEWILPLLFAVAMTYTVQYFLEPKLDQDLSGASIKSGSGFVAPTIEDINKPLNIGMQFRAEEEQSVELQTITTACGTYVFSNKGATLQAFSFPWQKGIGIINTMLSNEHCFFVAFEKNSPVMYALSKISGDETSDRVLEYSASFDGGTITKIFTVHYDSYQIDLDIAVAYDDNRTENPVQLRLFIPQPVMQPALNLDKITGFVNENNGLTTIDVTKKDTLQKFWALPTCFGYESRFLVHAFVKDETNLVQRAYMMKNAQGNFEGVLESRVFSKSASWKTKFFVGPKTAEAVIKVDDRLLKTLNFGWLSPISHTMLSFLKFLYEKIGNYGWAIILLTLLLKLLLLPFTLYGEKNMRKGADMQQKLAYLQKKYKDNPEMFDQQRAELIKKHGVPGLAGCLPLLLTLPILIGLNTVLSNSVELYGAPFLWIENLYAVDPYYILPILTGLAMLATPMDADPRKGLMRYAMALMMATIACYLSAGLVLFILMNSLTAALQAQLQKR